MSMKKSRILFWAFALGVAASAAAWADGRDVALGSDGTVYQVHADTYGKLFPGGKDAALANPVVALDVTPPDGSAKRILVPATSGADVESLPSVLFADDSQTVFLLWETELNVHPVLQLAGFDGQKWSKVIQVTGNPFALKTSPQFTITRDAYPETIADGTTTTHHLITLHLLWQETGGTNTLETFYSPIVINDGVYIGWNPIYNLDSFLPVQAAAAAAVSGGDVSTSLVSAPILQSGADARTIVVVYTSQAANRLAAIEIDALPEQLGDLAEKTRSHIVDLGRKNNGYPGNYVALAEDTRSHIVDLGVAFQPQVILSIADQAKAEILAEGAQGTDLIVLSEKVRSHIVDLGAQLSGWGLRSGNGGGLSKILQFNDNPDPSVGDSPASSSYLFQFRVASNLSVPKVGPGTVRLFASETGEDLIVSWAQADRLYYRNSRDDGSWSDPKQLVFSNNLNLDKAYQILDQRLRGH